MARFCQSIFQNVFRSEMYIPFLSGGDWIFPKGFVSARHTHAFIPSTLKMSGEDHFHLVIIALFSPSLLCWLHHSWRYSMSVNLISLEFKFQIETTSHYKNNKRKRKDRQPLTRWTTDSIAVELPKIVALINQTLFKAVLRLHLSWIHH